MIVPLEQLRVESFRGIRNITLKLHPKVTVLFGANAAGKTTILDALAIALSAIVTRVPRAKGRGFAKSGDIRRPWCDRREFGEHAGVESLYTRIAVESASIAWDVTRFRSAQDRRPGSTLGRSALHQWLDPLVREALDTPPGQPTTPIPLVAAYGTERAVVAVPLRERDFAREFERFDALDLALNATTRFKTVFEWFRLMEDEERREQRSKRDFDYRLPDLERVRRAVSMAGLRCGNPRVKTRPLRMLVDFEHDGGVEPLDIASLSDGYRTHFALIVDLARRMVQLNPSTDVDDPERGTNTRAIVLIDELDLHLDPPWQGRVISGLCKAFPNTQFVVTTHSEQVLGSVAAESVRQLAWDGQEIFVNNVPFAQGASGERILVELMNAPERVAGPMTSKLQKYRDLVGDGKGETREARSLRQDLEAAIRGDPQLHQADLEIQRRELLARLDDGGR